MSFTMFEQNRESSMVVHAIKWRSMLLAFGLFVVQTGWAVEQQTFDTANAAAEAFVQAMKNEDDKALLEVLGEVARPSIEVKDQRQRDIERKQYIEAIDEMWRLREDSATQQTMVIGAHAWPIPFPIIKTDAGWRFDTESGFEEVLNRVIGRHELAVIEVCEAYVDAQVDYASSDRDADEVLEYAQRFRSSPGRRDGLYWRTSADEELSPAGPLIASYKEHLEGREIGDPFLGYHYRILTGQGSHAPGGAHSYIINGNMIAGFAMVAFPADYGVSGIMTFIVSHQGKVYEKDLGEDTILIAASMTDFNPDETWRSATQEVKSD